MNKLPVVIATAPVGETPPPLLAHMISSGGVYHFEGYHIGGRREVFEVQRNDGPDLIDGLGFERYKISIPHASPLVIGTTNYTRIDIQQDGSVVIDWEKV